MNWVMGCVSLVNLVVLIHGSLMKFFKASRGLREGFPLSLLLFLLIVEGLSRLLYHSRMEGFIKRVRVMISDVSTNILFVDVVLLFGEGTVREWRNSRNILNIFCQAIGIEVSIEKYIMLSNELSREVEAQM
jgi:hypothetical protein